MSSLKGKLALASGETQKILVTIGKDSRFTLQVEGAGTVTVGAKMAGSSTFAALSTGLAAGKVYNVELHMIEAFQFTAVGGSATVILAGGA